MAPSYTTRTQVVFRTRTMSEYRETCGTTVAAPASRKLQKNAAGARPALLALTVRRRPRREGKRGMHLFGMELAVVAGNNHVVVAWVDTAEEALHVGDRVLAIQGEVLDPKRIDATLATSPDCIQLDVLRQPECDTADC